MQVEVALVPALDRGSGRLTPVRPRDARAWTAVAIDVLRATTTLAVARQNGAGRVIPVATPEEAFARREREPGALLCGERDGRRIQGFDLGNSPAEYGRETVEGRPLIFASTNGSLALLATAPCRRRLLGAFVNASAVVDALQGGPRVLLVCAGKLGAFALEDAACAGWLCARLAERGARLAGPAARLALALAPRDADGVRALVQGSAHGRYLRSLGSGYAADVEYCCRLDAIGQASEV
jgi:2-phosphosulfolactate phosphatase